MITKTIFKIMFISSFVSITLTAKDKPMKKFIVVGEKLIKGDIWQNQFVQSEYEEITAIALNEHRKKYPKSNVEIEFSFDEQNVILGFEKAEKLGAFGVIGYKRSPQAMEASVISQKMKIPFLTAVSPLNAVRTTHSICLSASHSRLAEGFKLARKRFDYPSITVLDEAQLTSLEYERIFKEAFDVKASFLGATAEILDKIKDKINEIKAPKINIFMSGYGLSQMDVVNHLAATFGDKLNFIVHSQWSFCEMLLAEGLKPHVKNLYAISDYANPVGFAGTGIGLSQEVSANNSRLKDLLSKVESKGIDEPVIYVMRDMLHISLEAAEASATREEYLKKIRNVEFKGYSDDHMIIEGTVRKRVFLLKWHGKGFKPVEVLQSMDVKV